MYYLTFTRATKSCRAMSPIARHLRALILAPNMFLSSTSIMYIVNTNSNGCLERSGKHSVYHIVRASIPLPPPVQVGRLVKISSRADVESAAQLASGSGVVVMDCSDWQSIPAENLVASFTVCLKGAFSG